MIKSGSVFFAVILLMAWAPDAACLSVGASYSQDNDPNDITEKARKIISDPSYQKRLAPESESKGIMIKSGSMKTSGYLIWGIVFIAIALIVALIVIWVVAIYRQREQKPIRPSPSKEPRNQEDGMRASLSEVESLASQGKYDDAIHHLLLLAVNRLTALRNDPVPHQLTSRELTNILPRTDDEKDLFKRMVSVVELSLFGNREMDEDDYHSCLNIYKGFAV